MRKRFEVQYELGTDRIEDVEMPKKSRDELPAVLRGLQEVYRNPELNQKIFEILERSIPVTNIGRPGMYLWEILVLGVVRLTLDANYDRLEHIANYDNLVRGIMGVSTFGSNKQYSLQSIKDNINLITTDMIDEINTEVVLYGYRIKKKDVVLNLRVDSYPLCSNVHFPTDINLLWDAARKCIDYVCKLKCDTAISGWRKHKSILKQIKYSYRRLCRVSAGGGKNKADRVQTVTHEYLSRVDQLINKLAQSRIDFEQVSRYSQLKSFYLEKLNYFEEMLVKHRDLVHRRLILGETIPHEEKMFSLFEPHTEWIKKGKSGNRVDLGLNVVVVTDQYNNILDKRILEKEHEVNVALPLIQDVIDTYPVLVDSSSFDKGFWSVDNFSGLSQILQKVIMPKKGKLNQVEFEREHEKEFQLLRNRHSAVESDINCLEHHGLDRCPDRGIINFKKYVSLGVLSYNLHKLGNRMLESDRKKLEKRKRKIFKAA